MAVGGSGKRSNSNAPWYPPSLVSHGYEHTSSSSKETPYACNACLYPSKRPKVAGMGSILLIKPIRRYPLLNNTSIALRPPCISFGTTEGKEWSAQKQSTNMVDLSYMLADNVTSWWYMAA